MKQIIFVELYKIMRKKITYLLLFPSIIPLFFGLAMNVDIDIGIIQGSSKYGFVVQEIGFAEFIYSMFSIANLLFIFIFLFLCSLLMAKEIETGEINLYILRVGKRAKIVLSKFFALMIIQTGMYILFFLLTSLVYFISAKISIFEGNQAQRVEDSVYVIALAARYLSTSILLCLSLFIGTKLKTFISFATVFILYIISLYFEHFAEWLQLLFPEHFASAIIERGTNEIPLLYFILFISYGAAFLSTGILLFKRKDF